MTDEQETRLDENISEEETLNFQQDSDMRPPEQDSDIRHQEEVELPFVEYDLNEEPPEMEVQQQPAATPGRQRSPALPITAAAIAVIILGSVAWVKFSGNEMVSKDLSGISAPMPDITLPASEIREKEVLAVASPDNGNVAVYTADMAELALPVAEIKDIREAPAAPAAVIAEAMPTNVIPIPEKAEALVALPAESTETSVKEASSIIKDEVVPAETAPAVAADVDMLKAKVSSLEEKIAALESRIALLTAPPKTAAATAPKAAAAPAKPAPKPQTVAASKPANAVNAVNITDDSRPAQRLELPKKAQTAPQLRAPTLDRAKPSNLRVVSNYVIRAAKPGQAWIAKSASATDLREVHVGDTVPGLGRIQSIFLDSNGWSIVGTEAVLR